MVTLKRGSDFTDRLGAKKPTAGEIKVPTAGQLFLTDRVLYGSYAEKR